MKKVFAIAVAATLLVGITALAYGAGKGPVAKATGGVELEPVAGPDDQFRYASFNAHEAKPSGAPKGKFHWKRQDDEGEVFHFVGDVVEVTVSGNTATFACVVKVSNQPVQIGKKLYVCVVDDATPGSGGDVLMLKWTTAGPPWTVFNVIGGNLVVHN